MKLRHKNKKPGKVSKGRKKNGKKAASKVASTLQFVHTNDHASREAELKKKRIEEMREKQQIAREQERPPKKKECRTERDFYRHVKEW